MSTKVNATIAVLPGDGIGEEVMAEALKVLSAIQKKFGHVFRTKHGLVGGAAYEKFKEHFPQVTRDLCADSGAILFGSVGGPVAEQHLEKWKNCEANSILALRKTFGFGINFRPAKVYPALAAKCPLKKEIVDRGIDLLIIRELLGDLYFGEHKTFNEGGLEVATDIARYDTGQIQLVAKKAFEAARLRRKKVTSVDKANVLDTGKLWRRCVTEVGKGYPDIALEHILVDNCAMKLITHPSEFDVLLCPNMFGDILSDEAAVFPGSLGLTPSASFNEKGFGLYEPSGGSAPDIAGKGVANPIAQILSVALLLRYSFGLEEEALLIESAVEKTLNAGFWTRDIFSEGFPGRNGPIGTTEITEKILSYLE